MAGITIKFEYLYIFLLVWARLTAMIVLNPIFARNNIPNMVRMGLVFFLTFLIAPLQDTAAIVNVSGIAFAFLILKELFVGIIYSFIFIIFYYLLAFAGDLMDTDMGFSNAKVFDPSTNIQASLSGRILTTLFILYFFATNSHMAMFRMYADSFQFIPPGSGGLGMGIPAFIIKLFSDVFSLVLRLYAPFMVAEFALQVSMGILMKLNPQITVFVINFQLRILLGTVLLFTFAPFIGKFVDNYIDIMFKSLQTATGLLG